MRKELYTIKLISDFLHSKKLLNRDINGINDIFDFFVKISKESNKFNSLYILNYIYNFISSDEINKRNTSARVFEDFLATIFNGIVTDNETRKNITLDVPLFFENVIDKIASNRREKADIVFNDKAKLSLKTLINDNLEINMGSFEKNVLFDGLRVDSYLLERKGKDGAGLGSKALLSQLFSVMLALNKNDWSKFKNKFTKMVEFIYADDVLIAIKNDLNMTLYFFSGDEIINLFIKHSENYQSLLKLINRWEGNSLRVDRRPFLDSCTKKVTLDFNVLKDSIIKDINNFDELLHSTYANFFNTTNNSKQYILNSLEELFNKFEANREILI